MSEVRRHDEDYPAGSPADHDFYELSDYDYDNIDMLWCEWCPAQCCAWAGDERWGDLCPSCAVVARRLLD